MTRPFNQQIHCPNCKTWITHESSFGRWIRNNPELDSRKGYCISDQDYWIHKYKICENRDFQCIMLVEIKIMGMKLSSAQRNLLHFVNQLMRNRKQTPTKELKWQNSDSITQEYSLLMDKYVYIKAFGVHILTFSGLGPDDSDWIMWDNKKINISQLTDLLKFNLDPDTLKPLDLRYHHPKNKKFGSLLKLLNG